jgi:hypothetical protein
VYSIESEQIAAAVDGGRQWGEGMIHYHGTPITPRSVLFELAGRCFCVPYSDPRDVAICHEIGQSVMIDNGAFYKRTRDGKHLLAKED